MSRLKMNSNSFITQLVQKTSAMDLIDSSTVNSQVRAKKQVNELPVHKLRNEIMQKINNNRVTLISGFTGSGKVRVFRGLIYNLFAHIFLFFLS